MYLSGALLAASPWLHCSNVNGGLGAVCRDPLTHSPAPSPSFAFSIKTAGIFQRVLALWLMWNSLKPHLPPHSAVHRPSRQCCFPLITLFFRWWVKGHLPFFFTVSHFLYLILSPLSHPCFMNFYCHMVGTLNWLTGFYSVSLFNFNYQHQTTRDIQVMVLLLEQSKIWTSACLYDLSVPCRDHKYNYLSFSNVIGDAEFGMRQLCKVYPDAK